jgi:hypothetical protein
MYIHCTYKRCNSTANETRNDTVIIRRGIYFVDNVNICIIKRDICINIAY